MPTLVCRIICSRSRVHADGLGELRFRLSAAVDIGVVEEIDALLQGGVNQVRISWVGRPEIRIQPSEISDTLRSQYERSGTRFISILS